MLSSFLLVQESQEVAINIIGSTLDHVDAAVSSVDTLKAADQCGRSPAEQRQQPPQEATLGQERLYQCSSTLL